MQAVTLISAEEFDLLAETDERRLEFLDGEVIEGSAPLPRHALIVSNLYAELRSLARAGAVGIALVGSEFQIGQERRLIPDLAFLLTPKANRMDPDETPILLIPDLAIEVISPSETALDVERKVVAYLEAGVAEVWTVYPNVSHIYLHTFNTTRLIRADEALTCALFPGWSTPAAHVFAI